MKTLLFISVASVGAVASSAQNYTLDWRTLDGGGGASTGGVFAVSGTVGQPDAGGPLTGGPYIVLGGFWPGANLVQTPYAPLLAIERLANGQMRLYWPRPATGFVLDQAAPLASTPAATVWSPVTLLYATNTTQISATVPPDGSRFYRLRKP